MDPITLWVARYSVQVLIVVGAAAVASTALKYAPASARLSAWRGVLLLCLLLPLVPARTVDVVLPLAADTSAGVGAAESIGSRAIAPHQWTVALWQLLLLGALVRGVWLAAGFARLRGLRAHAGDPMADEAVAPLWQGLAPAVDIRWHEHVAQPVTFGLLRPIVLLPPRLRALGPDIRRAAVCHELLHAVRHDWFWIIGEEIVRTI